MSSRPRLENFMDEIILDIQNESNGMHANETVYFANQLFSY
jgi:hypothetical protein